jgi:hypothetical protein
MGEGAAFGLSRLALGAVVQITTNRRAFVARRLSKDRTSLTSGSPRLP